MITRKMRFLPLVLVVLCCYCGTVNGFPAVPADDPSEQSIVSVYVDETYDVEDDVSGTSLLRNILNNVDKVHVTQDTVMHWMKQIQDAMNRGSLSSETVRRFIAAMKVKLADTPHGENCCVFG